MRSTKSTYKVEAKKVKAKEAKNITLKCCVCKSNFKKDPDEKRLNILLATDDFEVRWDLQDIVRKSDRKMIFKYPTQTDVGICDDCYGKIIDETISRICAGKSINE